VSIGNDNWSRGSLQPSDDRCPRLFFDDDHFAWSAEIERNPGTDSGQPENLPGVGGVAGEQSDAVQRVPWEVVLRCSHPGSSRRSCQRSGETVGFRTHGLGSDRGQVGEVRARLISIHLLERQDVGVQSPDSINEPIKIDHPVVHRAAVQDVECRQPHGKKVPIIAEQSPPPSVTSEDSLLRTALKHSASALKGDAIPFALGGGYALWVHGGPEPSHDVDLVVAESDVDMAANSIAAAGLRVERPPEDWLFKAYLEDDPPDVDEEPALVDVLHRLAGVPVTKELLDTSEEIEVLGLRMPVLPPTPIMTAKLLSFSEHYCDFEQPLLAVRAVREQLDWVEIRKAAQDHPFAEAFLFLLERLGILPPF
jgi:hypothetical protein